MFWSRKKREKEKLERERKIPQYEFIKKSLVAGIVKLYDIDDIEDRLEERITEYCNNKYALEFFIDDYHVHKISYIPGSRKYLARSKKLINGTIFVKGSIYGEPSYYVETDEEYYERIDDEYTRRSRR